MKIFKGLSVIIPLILGLSLFSVGSLLFAQDTESLIEKGLGLIRTRHFNPDNLSEAIKTYQHALNLEPNNAIALWHMAEAYLIVGDDEATTKEEKFTAYEKGLDYAKKAIETDPKDADAHFWVFANLSRIGQTRGVLKSLSMVPELKKELETIFAINPDHVLALYGQGCLYYELPRFAGGNLNKSIESFKKAISLDPNLTSLYVGLAKSLIKKRDYAQAKEVLDKLLTCKTPADPADYAIHDRPEAEELIEKIAKKIKK